MDYGKSGNPKGAKDLSRHKPTGHTLEKPKGSTKVPNRRPSKEELLAKLKAAKAPEKG
jgi:hypothetical protein